MKELWKMLKKQSLSHIDPIKSCFLNHQTLNFSDVSVHLQLLFIMWPFRNTIFNDTSKPYKPTLQHSKLQRIILANNIVLLSNLSTFMKNSQDN